MFVFSVLETEKSLVLAEKGSGDDDDVELIRAAEGFRLVATMNPGGDFGKKEVDVEQDFCSVLEKLREKTNIYLRVYLHKLILVNLEKGPDRCLTSAPLVFLTALPRPQEPFHRDLVSSE